MADSVEIKDVFSWFLMLVFVLIGILNIIYIHVVPGLFYLGLSLFYCPPLGKYARSKAGMAIPFYIKIIIAFLILWVTLAVGDLVEYFESVLL
jgi:predicted membrane protein